MSKKRRALNSTSTHRCTKDKWIGGNILNENNAIDA